MNYEEVMKLALDRGFYFPSCEVYSDANAGFWEIWTIRCWFKK